MSNLRNKLIRLAHQKPELRKDLLPLIMEKKEAGFFSESTADFVMEMGDSRLGDDFHNWFAFIMKIDGVDLSDKDLDKVRKAIAKLVSGKYNWSPPAVRVDSTVSQYGRRHAINIYQNNRLDNTLGEQEVFSEYKKKALLIMKYLDSILGGKLGIPKFKTHYGDAFEIAKKNAWTESNIQKNTLKI